MRRSDAGFTLIEVMQALVLAMISLAGAFTLLLSTVHANSGARDLTQAATAAEAKLEELRGLPFAALANGGDQVAIANTTVARSWTVATGPTAGTRTVTVRIQPPRLPVVELRTLIAAPST